MIRFVASISLLISSPMVMAACPSAPQTNFDSSKAGLISDKQTGLTWMRCSIGSSWDGSNCTGIPSRLEWKEAKQAITEINKGGGVSGHKDWRLPTVDELKTLINKQCFDPAVDSNSFMDTQPAGYWTSEASTQFPEGATVVHFYHGGDYLTNQIKPWFVRAVRK